MCRLFGYVADRPTAVIDGLGVPAYEAFTSLSALHGDGWGMAWRRAADVDPEVVTSPLAAAHDPRYDELAHQALGSAGVVHLRWATDGLAVAVENTHPFAADGYAMAHNGNIWPILRLDELLSETSLAHLVGSTDSERYFRFVLECIERYGDEEVGVLAAVRTLHTEFATASLHALLLTPHNLFAVHVNSGAPTPLKDLRERFADETTMPAGHLDSYFDLAYRVTRGSVTVISTGLTEEGWSPIPRDRVMKVDLSTLAVSVLDPRVPVPAE
jgi:predicted glutamine amidotransferase